MKVLLVCKLGNSMLTDNILLPLLSSRHTERVFVLRDFAGTLEDDRVEYLVPAKPSKGLWRHFVKIRRGIRAVRRNRIDVIVGVLNTPHGFIGRIIGLFTRRPYIHMTVAGHREFWVDGPRMEKLNLRFFGKGPRAVTVTGEQTRQYLLRKGVPAEKIFIMPNLPDEAFAKVPVDDRQRHYDIISFSRIDRNKNVILLIRALTLLKGRYPLKVAIEGDGDQLEAIKEAARSSGVDTMIDFLGYLPDIEDKIRLLSDSRIFISCSKGEGFPVALLEAMNCGCVPVVSNVGDIADVVVSGKNGYLFEDTDDPSGFVACLEKLLSDGESLQAMRAEAIKVKDTISVAANGKIWDRVLEYAVKK